MSTGSFGKFLEKEPWERNLVHDKDLLGNPLQHSCLENPQGQRNLAGCGPWGSRAGHDWTIKHKDWLKLGWI